MAARRADVVQRAAIQRRPLPGRLRPRGGRGWSGHAPAATRARPARKSSAGRTPVAAHLTVALTGPTGAARKRAASAYVRLRFPRSPAAREAEPYAETEAEAQTEAKAAKKAKKKLWPPKRRGPEHGRGHTGGPREIGRIRA
ncbi:hypothetical protein GCM10009864_11050 [Streptomyces lunalinharesii]|uniref:Uncharacterized protein n=1 Tax=Streptomyces lunalinharesii TaxID=333384 RepID=A0ABP6DSB1_9ACTN